MPLNINEKNLNFLPKIYFPGRIFYGERSMDFFQNIKGAKKLVIISEFVHKNYAEIKENFLRDNSYFYIHNGEPTAGDFEKIKNIAFDEAPEYIIAVGGGSVMDISKFLKNDLKIPLIAVPTTAGSGAEVSQHVILTENGIKKYYSSFGFIPDIVILNSAFLRSLEDNQISLQLMDALAHALEALVSRFSNKFSDHLALDAINTIFSISKDFTLTKNLKSNLPELQLASVFAGIAQSSAGTGLAHALAHYFGAKNSIFHSQAIAIFLRDVVEFNMKHTNNYKKLNVLKIVSVDNLISELKNIYTIFQINCPQIILNDDIDDAANAIKRDVNSFSNPYSSSIGDIKKIIKNHIHK